MAKGDASGALVQVRLFGRPSVVVDGTDVTPSLSKRAIWILAILASREDRSMERQHLAGLLWPDSSDSAALYNLRQTLAALRRSLGEAKDLCVASTRSVSLNLSPDVSIDVVQFDDACKSVKEEHLRRVVEVYGDPLLPDCDEPFAVLAREQREQAFLVAAERLVARHISNQDPRAAIAVLRRILAEDPYRESACRTMMSALAEVGEWPAALEQYRAFRKTLRRDLKTDTSAEAKALYKSIRSSAVSGVQKKDSRLGLPRPLTDLVGRETEIATVCSLLERCKLVTLSGPGGVGKTRLAIAIAHKVASQYLDGAHFVDLAPLQDEQTIVAAIAAALEIKEVGQRPTLDAVIDCLSEREIFLVLDNCEHVTDVVARLSERLLSLSRGLHLLATSRQTLGVRGEFVWAVPTLSVPKVSADNGEAMEVTADEQTLLMRLSAFRGGCTVRAIESVAEGVSSLIVDLIASLVDKSLVKVDVEGESTRYVLLETVREFAVEQLTKHGKHEQVHDKHRDYFLLMAEENYRPMSSLEEAKKFAAFEADHDNLRSAIAWCHTQDHHSQAIRMCAALSRFWDTHGHVNEGRGHMEKAIQKDAPDLSLETRGRALVHAGWFASVQGDTDVAIRYYDLAREIAKTRGDDHARGVIETCVSATYANCREFVKAEEHLMVALEIRRASNRPVMSIFANLAEIALQQDKYDRGRFFLEEAVREMGTPNPHDATPSGTILRTLALVDWHDGKCVDARAHVLDALQIFKAAADLYEFPFTLMIAAFVESSFDRWDRAIKILSACKAFLDSQGTPPPDFLARVAADVEAKAQAVLGERDLGSATQSGKSMSIDAAYELVQSPGDSQSERLVMLASGDHYG